MTTESDIASPAASGVAAVNTAPPSIAITGAAPCGSTSALVRWYVITVGCEMGVFQGWYVSPSHIDLSIQCSSRHNVHSHVIGVPGACFRRYSSHASADEAYAQALEDGTVHELPL
jgi:hypothetical protein